MRAEIKRGVLRDVSYVTAHLRPADVVEVLCQIPNETKRHELAYSLLFSGECFTAHIDGQPVAAFGWSCLNSAAVGVWALGTSEMRRAIPAITRHYKTLIGPDLVERGFLTMEARSHVAHSEAHLWMTSTGAVTSGVPYIYGKKGEKFLTFRWTAEAFTRNRNAHGD